MTGTFLDRRIRARREIEKAYNNSPEGIASRERAELRQLEREIEEANELEDEDDEPEDEEDAQPF